MKRAFWRGMMAGSVLGALMSMMKKPQRKLSGVSGIKNNLRRMSSRRNANRMIRNVSRTVNGIIKRSK